MKYELLQSGSPDDSRALHLLATLAASLLICSLLVACDNSPKEISVSSERSYSATSPVTVLTVNYPLQYFAERIGGEYVQALYPGPTETDPANWKPDAESIFNYQQADLIVLNGAGYAAWLKQVSLPVRNQLDTSMAFSEQLLPLENTVAHTHGPTGEHVHDDLAFTVWLDPELAAAQAIAIHAALVKLLPDQAETLNTNLAALTSDLWALHTELTETLASTAQQQIIYSHPVYQYLDRRYRLNGMAVHWEPDEMPSEKEFEKLQAMNGALMIWEAEPIPETIARLEAMGIRSVVFDPCATQPETGDYLSVMQTNLQQLRSAVP